MVSLIRESKQAHLDQISNKLKSDSLSSKNWWSILKTFISPNSESSVPLLDHNGTMYTEEEKANTLNNFFRDQTVLNDNISFLPDILLYPFTSYLDSIVLSPFEVESVLKTLATGKASGPDGLNNRVLNELANEISVPFCSHINYSLRTGSFPKSWKLPFLLCQVIVAGIRKYLHTGTGDNILACV